MAAVSEMCCVCSCDVSAGTNKTKRRKVYGEAGKVALGILDNLKDLKQITDVIKQNGILCSDSNRKLNCKSVSLSKLHFSSVNLDKVQDWIMERIVPHFL